MASEKRNQEESQFPIKRHRELEAEILRFKNNDEDWIAFIGLLDGRPYEIFTGRKEEDTFLIPTKVDENIRTVLMNFFNKGTDHGT